ncbi:MAG TPA: acetyl-CoA carboxylase biotin carboxyl carrier protein [Acidisoma sp.]|jgi:acetyl-CoA carboxylase biotin carboxyl carrier protein|uniref:acetyl-CoA carboxylase biotin carboxyl carrier protein n=1 Tax=Acidisoma sp. TaxID=1872115 RepID=UPI002B93B16F|nr:acetyl-CoA carboxylase biotin carboxyl carrier protein [Acidisoma sp.]HTI00423.1 acetyl-CoA carboxylase biotin carboxyl carrier protein [Acidisoma sp.]
MNRLSFDPEDIRELAAILDETGLSEIEISEKDRRIRIARAPAPVSYSMAPQAAAPAAAPVAPAPAVLVPPAALDASHPGAVTSPMVGVAYLSPDPESPNFVSIGQRVEAGQTLLLIEAMKTFNQIKAPRSGTISQVIVGAGTPVEFGEVLMILD